MCQLLQMMILHTHKVYDPIESLSILTAILLKISQINLTVMHIQKLEKKKLAFWSKLP